MAEHSVHLELDGHARTSAIAVVTERGVGYRLVRSLLTLGGIWAAAFVCVFIPLAHFVLVPLLLLAGPIVAAVRFFQRTSFEAVRGACPKCGTDRFQASGQLKDARTVWCPGCGNDVTIRLSPS